MRHWSAKQPTKTPAHRFGRPQPGPLNQFAAFFLPFLGILWQMRGAPLWRTDRAILASLQSQTELSGSFSSLLGSLCLYLPLGSSAFRLALPSALFGAFASLVVLHLSHWLFRKQQGYSRLDSWLAMGAALSVAFSLPWLSESTVAGGATVGAALALVLLTTLLSSGFPRTWRAALFFGLCLGVVFVQSVWCGTLLLVSALFIWPEATSLGDREFFRKASSQDFESTLRAPLGKWGSLILGTLSAIALLSIPTLINLSIDTSQILSNATDDIERIWPLWSPLAWVSSIGFLWCGGALIAIIFSLSDRRPIYALTLIICADLLAPGSGAMGWNTTTEVDPNRLGLHLLALGVTAPLGALGLRTVGESAQALKLFAARPIAAMVAVLAVAGCLATAEDSLRILQATGTSGTQAWTDEALEPLPAHSLVLTRSATWSRRLLTAQAQGYRPDVLVVPLNDVTDARALSLWLEKEPALEILLRDLSLSETPSERAITRLADERPVYLEADPSWDKRLLEHLLPGTPLVAFSTHALARSDRLAALDELVAPRERIIQAQEQGLTPDRATQSILAASWQELASVLTRVGDKSSLKRLHEMTPQKLEAGTLDAPPLQPLVALTP